MMMAFNRYLKKEHFYKVLTLFRLGFLEILYDWGGYDCPRSLFVYISAITNGRVVIQVCIERKFYTLLI